MKYLFLLLLTSKICFSQVIIKIGPSAFLGDLGGNQGIGMTFIKDFNTKALGYEIGIGYKFNHIVLEANYVYVHDADTFVINRNGGEWWRWIRKFWFKDNIIEFTQNYQWSWHSVFFKIGIGEIYYFIQHDASTYLSNIKEKSYSQLQIIIPLSIGIHLSENIAIQFNYRKTFTDYLDNVSLRGDSHNKDAYFTLNILFFIQRKDKSSYEYYHHNQLKCPLFY